MNHPFFGDPRVRKPLFLNMNICTYVYHSWGLVGWWLHVENPTDGDDWYFARGWNHPCSLEKSFGNLFFFVGGFFKWGIPKAMGFNTKMVYLGMNLGVHAILGNMQLCLKELDGWMLGEGWGKLNADVRNGGLWNQVCPRTRMMLMVGFWMIVLGFAVLKYHWLIL